MHNSCRWRRCVLAVVKEEENKEEEEMGDALGS